jgi:hypothetical protein
MPVNRDQYPQSCRHASSDKPDVGSSALPLTAWDQIRAFRMSQKPTVSQILANTE